MALLVGRHVNKIDRKGRVSVPKPFRAAFSGADVGPQPLYLFPSFKYPALEGCGEDVMERLAASLDELDLFSDDQDDLAAVILESATALTPDPEGRVILPADLVEHAGLQGEAVFVGRGSRFQIWSPAAHAAHAAAQRDRARARGATLKLRTKAGDDD
ncbi:MAG: division/cell wall cluster transcriptional repressor MraZ [Rhodospirillales bacterium]